MQAPLLRVREIITDVTLSDLSERHLFLSMSSTGSLFDRRELHPLSRLAPAPSISNGTRFATLRAKGVPMSSIGFNEPLYIQPFDHRGSFETGMFGWTGALSPDQTAAIAATKQVIYD